MPLSCQMLTVLCLIISTLCFQHVLGVDHDSPSLQTEFSLIGSYLGENDKSLFLMAKYQSQSISQLDSYEIKFDFDGRIEVSEAMVNITINGIPRHYLSEVYRVHDNFIPHREIPFSNDDMQIKQPVVGIYVLLKVKVINGDPPTPSLIFNYRAKEDHDKEFSMSFDVPVYKAVFPSSRFQLEYDQDLAPKFRAPFVLSFSPTLLPNTTTFFLQILGSSTLGGDFKSCSINKVPVQDAQRIDSEHGELYQFTVLELPRSRENNMVCPNAFVESKSQLLFEMASYYQFYTFVKDSDDDDGDNDGNDGDDNQHPLVPTQFRRSGDATVHHRPFIPIQAINASAPRSSKLAHFEEGELRVNTGLVIFFETTTDRRANKIFQIIVGALLGCVIVVTVTVLCYRRECCGLCCRKKQPVSDVEPSDAKYFVFGGTAILPSDYPTETNQQSYGTIQSSYPQPS